MVWVDQNFNVGGDGQPVRTIVGYQLGEHQAILTGFEAGPKVVGVAAALFFDYYHEIKDDMAEGYPGAVPVPGVDGVAADRPDRLLKLLAGFIFLRPESAGVAAKLGRWEHGDYEAKMFRHKLQRTLTIMST